jgi:hypothetical protein
MEKQLASNQLDNFNTKLMIEKWYNVNIPYQNINRIWEQSALWKVYKGWQSSDPDNLVILENINMVEKENQYLRHITTGESHHRVTYFRDFIERKKINYTENLEDIIEEQFDTNLLYSNKIKKSRIYKKYKRTHLQMSIMQRFRPLQALLLGESTSVTLKIRIEAVD